jgi:hypothetical protein
MKVVRLSVTMIRYMLALSPRLEAIINFSVGFAADAFFHQVVLADGTRLHLNVPAYAV